MKRILFSLALLPLLLAMPGYSQTVGGDPAHPHWGSGYNNTSYVDLNAGGQDFSQRVYHHPVARPIRSHVRDNQKVLSTKNAEIAPKTVSTTLNGSRQSAATQ